MLRTVVAMAGGCLLGACSSKGSQAPAPAVLLDGIYRFSEAQRPMTTPIEGTMTILRDTVMVEAQPGPCRYDDRMSWGKTALVYQCAEMTLMFDRVDPVRNSKFDTKVSVDEKKNVCTQYTTTATGQRICVQSETQMVSRDVDVSGFLHPKRIAKEAQP